jgi:hypothetical protein
MVGVGFGFSLFFIFSMNENYLVRECARKTEYLKTLEMARAQDKLANMKLEDDGNDAFEKG